KTALKPQTSFYRLSPTGLWVKGSALAAGARRLSPAILWGFGFVRGSTLPPFGTALRPMKCRGEIPEKPLLNPKLHFIA
ncbi:MAG: hypothetical protein IJA35_01870, partial [Clostridia bacterium]|nr:hypothetical protein [Clostridia bacterium]